MGVEILAVQGIGEVVAGDDLVELIASYAPPLRDGDVLVVTSKIVSKAEGRVVDLDREAAIDAETVRVVARRGNTRIVTTRHGFVMAAAGVDASNVEKGRAVLLPLDSDASARRLRDGIRDRLGVDIGVIISDTFGRPWRVGVTDVAVGVAGLAALDDLRGTVDSYGNDLQVTVTCIADEIAAAADLVKGKLSAVPIAIVRGLSVVRSEISSGIGDVVRSADDDMFSLGTRDVLPARVDALSFGTGMVSIAAVARAISAASYAASPVDSFAPASSPGTSTTISHAATSPASFPDMSLPEVPIGIEFLVVEPLDVKGSIDELLGSLAASAALFVIPWLPQSPRPSSMRQLLAAGAAIENVLVGLAIEQLASRWILPENPLVPAVFGLDDDARPLGVITIGQPA